jgi:hypothetical protein
MSGCSSTLKVQNNCNTVDQCVELIKSKIGSHWKVDKHDRRKKIVVQIYLDSNANVIDLKVISNSGSEELEKGVIKAVKNSSPFFELLDLPPEEFEMFKWTGLVFIPE